jgi:hypothetical protein
VMTSSLRLMPFFFLAIQQATISKRLDVMVF